MELGAGHFIRLELATESQISTPFVRDIAQMARNVVERARIATNPDKATNILDFQQQAAADKSASPDKYPTDGFNGLVYEDGMNEVRILRLLCDSLVMYSCA